MKKKSTILILLLLLIGVGVLAYPTVSNLVNQQHGSYAIQELQAELLTVEDEKIAEQRRLAEEYNAKLLGAVPADAFSSEKTDLTEEYESILNFSGGMMGYLQIPKINVNLPIYHGTGEEVLAKGVGHMPESAFPIGGEGNHAVLTGHTGLPSAELFTDLTEMAEGDMFYISILNDTLAYEVDQIKVVLPSEGQDLTAVPGKDYCTLVTCTPYGVNSHRLLVRGKRAELPQQEAQQQLQQELEQQAGLPMAIITAAILLLAVLMGVLFLLLIRRRKGRR